VNERFGLPVSIHTVKYLKTDYKIFRTILKVYLDVLCVYFGD